MTTGNRLSKRKWNVLRRDGYFYCHHYSFQICITDQAWGQYDLIYGQIPFLHFVRLSRSPLFFFLVCYATRLGYATSSVAARLVDWSSLRSLLRTYERSTYSKSSILFSDTKSGPKKKWTTPIYATCTSPIMHLICLPKFWISIIFNFFWDSCNTEEKWKATWKITCMQILGGK